MDRFWSKVTKTEGCWLWNASKCSSGYGTFGYEGRVESAHRVSLKLSGVDPKGYIVLHTCDNPACVNPAHLTLGTHADNMEDMKRKGRKSSKLSPDDVRAIKKLLADSMSQTKIAAMFNVNQSQISYIKSGKYWSHIT